jgi:hypothetical protein
MVVVTICLSLGLQWAALQGIAWTGMLISFSQEGSLIEAMEKTFDGAHPCALCKVVEEGEKQDQNTAVKSPLKKMEALMAQVLTLIAPSGQRMIYPTLIERAVVRLAPPLGKPPRALTA